MATIVAQTGSFNISTHNPYISGYVQWRETYDDSTYIATNKTRVEMGIANEPTSIIPGRSLVFAHIFHPNHIRKYRTSEAIIIRVNSHGLGHEASTSRMSGVDFSVPMVK
jgi:hypothetical protein